MKKNNIKFKYISVVCFLSPILLYWFINGDYKRYIWIINGPKPFSDLGSGPLQLWLYMFLILLGIVTAIIAFVIEKSDK